MLDETVIKHYRKLLREGFEHAGSLENPSIFLNTIGEKIRVCGMSPRNFINIYIDIDGGVVKDIRYLCTCDPTANVVVEILCSLVKGKTIEAAETLTEDSFVQALGSKGEEYLKKVRGIIELINRGISRYKMQAA